MKRRTVIKGGGITARLVEETRFEGPVDEAEAAEWKKYIEERNAAKGWTFDGAAAPFEARMMAWRDDPAARPPLQAGEDGSHSAEALARKALKLIAITRGFIKRGDADGAARWAYELGVLAGEVSMKATTEPLALQGWGSRKGSRKGAERKRTTERDAKLAAEYVAAREKAQRSGETLPTRAEIGNNFGLAPDAARRAIARGKRLLRK